MLKLIAPGKRGNKYWVVRGSLDGEEIEKSLKVSLRSHAEEKLRELLRIHEKTKKENDNVTFSIASQRYIDFKNPSPRTQNWLENICSYLGDKLVFDITQNDLVATANSFYGREGSPASKNRAVIRPAAAVLHYAAKNKWCDWLRIDTFKEASPKTRYVTYEVERSLHNGLRQKGTRWRVQKRLLLLWLFRQGDRISDALRSKYEDIDFQKQTIKRHISKSDRHVTLPLDATICRYLKRAAETDGPVFLWQTHYGVNRWLQNLTEKLGVEFTPHMARHTLGKRLNDSGAALKTIMQALGQSDPKSAIRYQTTDIETIREAKKKTGKNRGI